MKFIIAQLLLILTTGHPSQAFAFPVTSEGPLRSMTLTLFEDGFVDDAVVRLNNCSASLVKWSSAKDTQKAIVMTNGHCVGSPYGGMLRPGEVLHNKKRNTNMALLDRNGRSILRMRSEIVLYATMTDTDVAFLELTESYSSVKAKSGVEPLVLDDVAPSALDAIRIPSGYWNRTYSCHIEATVHQLKESDWLFTNSLRYSPEGCEVIGGTSGSPIVSVATGKVIAINNTGNENGRRCTLNNPCEIDPDGNVTVIPGRGYGQQTHTVYTCVNEDGLFDLSLEGCVLPKGTAAVVPDQE